MFVHVTKNRMRILKSIALIVLIVAFIGCINQLNGVNNSDLSIHSNDKKEVLGLCNFLLETQEYQILVKSSNIREPGEEEKQDFGLTEENMIVEVEWEIEPQAGVDLTASPKCKLNIYLPEGEDQVESKIEIEAFNSITEKSEDEPLMKKKSIFKITKNVLEGHKLEFVVEVDQIVLYDLSGY